MEALTSRTQRLNEVYKLIVEHVEQAEVWFIRYRVLLFAQKDHLWPVAESSLKPKRRMEGRCSLAILFRSEFSIKSPGGKRNHFAKRKDLARGMISYPPRLTIYFSSLEVYGLTMG